LFDLFGVFISFEKKVLKIKKPSGKVNWFVFFILKER